MSDVEQLTNDVEVEGHNVQGSSIEKASHQQSATERSLLLRTNSRPANPTAIPIYTLTRTRSDEFHTAGQLTGPGLDRAVYTIEREWNNNAVGSSCIPPGDYEVEKYQAPSFGPCWILSNRSLGVSKFPEPGIRRSAILIHAANFAFQLQGCIAPGAEYRTMIYQGTNPRLQRFRNRVWPAVTNSVPTMEYLRARLPSRFRLTIR